MTGYGAGGCQGCGLKQGTNLGLGNTSRVDLWTLDAQKPDRELAIALHQRPQGEVGAGEKVAADKLSSHVLHPQNLQRSVVGDRCSPKNPKLPFLLSHPAMTKSQMDADNGSAGSRNSADLHFYRRLSLVRQAYFLSPRPESRDLFGRMNQGHSILLSRPDILIAKDTILKKIQPVCYSENYGNRGRQGCPLV